MLANIMFTTRRQRPSDLPLESHFFYCMHSFRTVFASYRQDQLTVYEAPSNPSSRVSAGFSRMFIVYQLHAERLS